MPEAVKIDQAVKYITAHGVIRVGGKSYIEEYEEERRKIFYDDIYDFMSAIQENVHVFQSIFSNELIELRFNSNTSSSFKLVFKGLLENTAYINVEWGSDNVYRLAELSFNSGSLIHWAIYSNGNGEIGVTLARVSNFTLPDNPKNYTPPNETIWNETVGNTLSLYVPFSFMVVKTIDNVLNKSEFVGIVVVGGKSIDISVNYEKNQEKPTGVIINTTTDVIESYDEKPVSISTGIGSPMLLCGDSHYYSNINAGRAIAVHPPLSVHVDNAASDYLIALWASNTRCVTSSLKFSIWGGTLDPNGVDHGLAHRGPQVIEYGKGNYFLRCLATYLPIDPPSDDEYDDEDEEDTPAT